VRIAGCGALRRRRTDSRLLGSFGNTPAVCMLGRWMAASRAKAINGLI